MSWKRAVFFGGAVLVLSACADATAPSTLRQAGNGSVVFSKKATTTTTTTPDSTVVPDGDKSDDCTGIVIHVGAIDGSAVPICVVLTTPILW